MPAKINDTNCVSQAIPSILPISICITGIDTMQITIQIQTVVLFWRPYGEIGPSNWDDWLERSN